MEHLYFLLGLGAVVLLAFILSLRRTLRSRFRLPYRADETLFTPSQRTFKAVLERAVGKDYRVYGRVRVADVIGLQARLSRREEERAQARLDERCFDFLICTPDVTAIACAVNLSPRSRLRKQLPRDSLDRICAAARLPFVRFRESDVYSLEEVEERIFAAMRARWTGARNEEIPLEDAATVLHELSSVILDKNEEHVDRSQTRRAGVSRRKQRPLPAQARPAWSDPVQSRVKVRREPSILDREDIDEGPDFRIDDDLEEDRAARIRRGLKASH